MSATTTLVTTLQTLSGSRYAALSGAQVPPPLLGIETGGTLDVTGGVTLAGTIVETGTLPLAAASTGIYLATPGAVLLNSGTILNQAAAIGYSVTPASSNPVFIGADTLASVQGGFAVSLAAGRLDNEAGGTIQGGLAAIYDSAGGTILNAGLIEGIALAPVTATQTTWSSAANAYVTSLATLAAPQGNGIDLGGAVNGITILNAGTIAGADGIASGWYWQTGSQTIVNEVGGLIEGSSYAITLALGLSSVSNAGTIAGGNGVGLQSGMVDNQASGLISVTGTGVTETGLITSSVFTLANQGNIVGDVGVQLGLGTLVNQGSIAGGMFGVADYGGVAVNQAGGVITGGGAGVLVAQQYLGFGTLLNSGVIAAPTGTGVEMTGTSALYNQVGGVISGTIGVAAQTGETITNAGTIDGTSLAVSLGVGDRLVVEAGAVFGGAVSAATALVTSYSYQTGTVSVLQGGVLEFANGTGSENLDSFSGFTNLQFDSLSGWIVTGSEAAFGTGVTLSGLQATDTLVIEGLSATSATYVYGAGLELGGETLQIGTSLAYGTFTVTTDGTDTTLNVAPCFCAGTLLRTPTGEVAVETLRPGDEVETLHGGRQRIAWIGSRAYDGRFIEGQHLMLPVTLRAGSLAPGVPVRDLHVSPGHAIWADGLLVPAWRLVNGVNITQAEHVERVQYFHIELLRHELVLADGCPTESFYDDICRGQFQQSQGEIPPVSPPLPRCEGGFALAALRARLAAAAGLKPAPGPGHLRGFIDSTANGEVAGWAQDEANPETPVVLDVLRAGQRVARVIANLYREDLRAAGLGTGCHAFALSLPRAPGIITVQRAADAVALPFSAAPARSDVA